MTTPMIQQHLAADITYTATANGTCIWTQTSITAADTGGFRLSILSDSETLRGTSGNDYLTGATQDNQILGYAGNDVLSGGDGNDALYGSTGNDVMYGGTGDDVLKGESGNDRFVGNAGIDTADFRGSTAVTIDLNKTSAQNTGQGKDMFSSIENILSGSKNDTLIGDKYDNSFVASKGNDKLYGGKGDDFLRGDKGNDLYSGGKGKDTVVFTGKRDITVDLNKNGTQNTGEGKDKFSKIENITTDRGDDRLTGNKYDNVFDAGRGNDTVNGSRGNDTIIFSDDNKVTLNLGRSGTQNTGYGKDKIKNIENVISGDGRDKLTGSRADNSLDSGGGNDRLDGGKGDDTLAGGTGKDVLKGGSGEDVFRFFSGDGNDRILDFKDNVDTLVIKGYTNITSPSYALYYASEINGDVVFDLGNGDTLTVKNITESQLLNDLIIG